MMQISDKQTVLQKYQLTAADLLADGMEAEVYRYGVEHVLKLYRPTQSIQQLHTLKQFYANLDRSLLSFNLPTIESITDEGSAIVVIERHLAGIPLSMYLQHHGPRVLAGLFPAYCAAVSQLARMPMPAQTTRYKLFDPDRLSELSDGDWHAFLRCWLSHQVMLLNPVFERDVSNVQHKLAALDACLARPYTGPYQLIHGDIYPGNLLVHQHGSIQALVDFGLFTMYGDPLFDVATAWVFFDMYDELHSAVRSRLLAVFVDQLGEHVRGRLSRYMLLYSLLSANTYAPDCSDGHYQWCMANLNTEEYWSQIE